MPISSMQEIRALFQDLPGPNTAAQRAAQAHNGQLTKPPGALGRLEALAIWYAAWNGNPRPTLTAPQVVVFAGNHGVAAAGVSAFPPEVTAQMVANFEQGGAAINQLCAAYGARLDVKALDLDVPTDDFTKAPAMTEAAFTQAWTVGWNAVDTNADLFIAGEMGIGNTTSAAALAAALFGGAATDWVGRGTGVDDDGLTRKRRTVNRRPCPAQGGYRRPTRGPAPSGGARAGRDGRRHFAGAASVNPSPAGRLHLHSSGGGAGKDTARRPRPHPGRPPKRRGRTRRPAAGIGQSPDPVA